MSHHPPQLDRPPARMVPRPVRLDRLRFAKNDQLVATASLQLGAASKGAKPLFTKILVAIDGSPASEKALAAAVDLAANFRAELTALGVVEVPEVVGMIDEVDEIRQGTEAYLRQINEAAVNYARSRGVVLRSVLVRGHAAEAIVKYAESEGVNLIVV